MPLKVRGCPADCQPGWFPLIQRLDAALAAIDPAYCVNQIKEKHGTLAYYADPVTAGTDCDAFYAAIDAAEKESEAVCEVCGGTPARVVGGSWLAVRCRRCVP